MENIMISKKQEDLLDIARSINLYLKEAEKKKQPFLVQLAIDIDKLEFGYFVNGEKNEEKNYDDKDEDLEHFSFFVKKLFLGKNKNFDFDFEELKKLLDLKIILEIFDSLEKYIKSKDFFGFLLKLGDISSNMYFKQDNIKLLMENYRNKGINNYECLFRIFSKYKSNKDFHFIYGNYDIYFSELYFNEIKYNLILSFKIYINFSINGPNYDDLSLFNIDERNESEEPDSNANKIKNFEEFFKSSIKNFWLNSFFLINNDLFDFVNIFYDFLAQKGLDKFTLDNKFDDSIKMYLEYISYHLEVFFKYFSEESLNEFYLSSYEFVDNHKGENIKFVERTINIGQKYKLTQEKIGLIAFIFCNNKFITSLENLANSDKKLTKNQFDTLADKEGYSECEEYIAKYIIFDEMALKKTLNKPINKPINGEFNINNIKENKNVDIKNVIINNIPQPENEQKNKIDKPKILVNKEDYANDPKYKTLLDLIEQLNNYIANQDEKIKQCIEKNDKFDKEILSLKENQSKEILILKEEHSKEISSLKDKIKLNEEKHDKDIKKNSEDIMKLNKQIKRLNNLHKTIYFRDISQFYIDQFSRNNKMMGNNTFDNCQRILKFDFDSHNIGNLKELIIKIVTHYLSGNKLAHMEFFIDSNKSFGKKKMIDEIRDSYAEFMKFSNEEKILLSNKYDLFKASFIYYYRFK